MNVVPARKEKKKSFMIISKIQHMHCVYCAIYTWKWVFTCRRFTLYCVHMIHTLLHVIHMHSTPLLNLPMCIIWT